MPVVSRRLVSLLVVLWSCGVGCVPEAALSPAASPPDYVDPIAGRQWAIDENVVGSRFVVFLAFQPEVMLWPVRPASDQSGGAVPEAPAAVALFRRFGDEPTLQRGTSAGIRLEL